jgi:hypothetical protein
MENEMKNIIGVFLALFASVAFGATLNPIQLLNPAGSASGQAIVSTGASTAPAWGGVGVNGIAAIAANTVLANGTGSSASPTAFAMPSCSTSASALNWTMSSGFTCNTAVNAALLSGSAIGTSGATVPLLNGANTWSGAQSFTSTITPSQTAGIVGTTTNNNANAGSIGEYPTPSTVTGTSLTTVTPTNVGSLSLAAGDWDVSGVGRFNGTSVVMVSAAVGTNTTSATIGSFGTFASVSNMNGTVTATTNAASITLPTTRYSLSATTTVYCVMSAQFSSGTMTGDCFLRARRVR